MSILRNTFRWGHLCPTAPDTLSCYPFTDHDPFVIINSDSHPATVYFAGNQPAFAHSLEEAGGRRVVFVCVPSFRQSRQAVLVNLRSLAARVVSFEVGLGDEQVGGNEGGEAGEVQVPMAVE